MSDNSKKHLTKKKSKDNLLKNSLSKGHVKLKKLNFDKNFVPNIKDFANVVKKANQRETHVEGIFTDLETELRTPVENIDEFNDDERNNFIGSQVQIFVHTAKEDLEDPYFLTSGMLINKNFEVEGLTIPVGNKSLILSTAHSFVWMNTWRQHALPASAAFSYRKTLTNDGQMKMETLSHINGFHVYPKYMEKPARPDSYSDLAIAICEENLKNLPSPTKIRFSNVNKAKEGDTICIAGYPIEQNGKLFYMKGKIGKIDYRENGEDAIILYRTINTTHGQNGSPVFLEQSDGSWSIIGFHLGYSYNWRANFAVGLTANKLSWIVNKATHTLFSFEKNNIENFFTIENTKKITNEDFAIGRALRPYRRPYNLPFTFALS